MADKLDTYSFPGRRNKYNWDQWLNGSIWRLHRGTDFVQPVASMRGQAYNAATKRGLKLLSMVEDENTLVLQAVVS